MIPLVCAIPAILSGLRLRYFESYSPLCLFFGFKGDKMLILLVFTFITELSILLLTLTFSILSIFYMRKSATAAGRAWSATDVSFLVNTVVNNVTRFLTWMGVQTYTALQLLSVDVSNNTILVTMAAMVLLDATIKPIVFTFSKQKSIKKIKAFFASDT